MMGETSVACSTRENDHVIQVAESIFCPDAGDTLMAVEDSLVAYDADGCSATALASPQRAKVACPLSVDSREPQASVYTVPYRT